jgi:hypothetical protein
VVADLFYMRMKLCATLKEEHRGVQEQGMKKNIGTKMN